MVFNAQYEQLNSLYLVLYDTLDQFFPGRSDAVPEFPQLRIYARRLSELQEGAGLKDYFDPAVWETIYGGSPQDMKRQYLSLVQEVDERYKQKLDDLKNTGHELDGLLRLEDDVNQVLVMLRSYADDGQDISAWMARAYELRDRLRELALEYSDRIYSDEEAWNASSS